ncbi:hypothetical protein PM082_013849 [Marasmius tenuissimus]|nr:hypothetical protein PM082_013849 [Marasmius tenuissimus]
MTRRHSHQLQMDSVPAIQSQRNCNVDVGHGFDSKPLNSISKGLFQNHVYSTVTVILNTIFLKPATITRLGDSIVFFLSVSIHALPLNVCERML